MKPKALRTSFHEGVRIGECTIVMATPWKNPGGWCGRSRIDKPTHSRSSLWPKLPVISTSDIAFLLYHDIALPGRELCETEPGYVCYVLEAPEFEAQVLAIRDAGLHGVSVTRALEFPSRAVAVTF